VELKDNPKIGFEGIAPSNPWLIVMKKVEQKRRKVTRVDGNRSLTISGPAYFGLSSPLVIHFMEQMEGVDQLTKFEKRSQAKPEQPTEDDEDESSEELPRPPSLEPAPKPLVVAAPLRHGQCVKPKSAELTLDFSLLRGQHREPTGLVVKLEELLQRSQLDIAFPFGPQALKGALEKMAIKIRAEYNPQATI
jgi:hypothetical protein